MNAHPAKGRRSGRALSAATRRDVLTEAGYMCGNPRCRHILTLELHHIVWVKDGGGNDASNLLCLCPNCHALHTQGHIPQTAIRHWKGMLLALNHALDRESLELLLFLHRTAKNSAQIWYSGDGVLRFARLIAANLVQFGAQVSVNIAPPHSSHQMELSERGRLLVEAWLQGDSERYSELIAASQH